MYYLFKNDTFVPLQLDQLKEISEEKVFIASDSIKDMVNLLNYKNAAFIVTKENFFSLFTFWTYQLRYCNFKEFNTIIFTASCNFGCNLLKFVAKISCGKYTLIQTKGLHNT